MTQNSSKIQGKFYPLQHEEWLKACRELTPAQKDVLYYIRTLNPYGDGVELSVSGIARQLSTENKEVHRSTVSRALKALDDKGFIDLELLKVQVKILAGGLHCCDEATLLPHRNKRDRYATSVIMTQQTRSLRNNRVPKALPRGNLQVLRLIRLIQTLLRLSRKRSERIFGNFVRKKPKILASQ